MSFADSFTAWLEDSILLKTDALLVALNQTLQLVFVPFVFVVLFGIPLGVILYVTSPGGLSPVRWLNRHRVSRSRFRHGRRLNARNHQHLPDHNQTRIRNRVCRQ